jgi:hypothetical protein
MDMSMVVIRIELRVRVATCMTAVNVGSAAGAVKVMTDSAERN